MNITMYLSDVALVMARKSGVVIAEKMLAGSVTRKFGPSGKGWPCQRVGVLVVQVEDQSERDGDQQDDQRRGQPAQATEALLERLMPEQDHQTDDADQQDLRVGVGELCGISASRCSGS